MIFKNNEQFYHSLPSIVLISIILHHPNSSYFMHNLLCCCRRDKLDQLHKKQIELRGRILLIKIIDSNN